MSSDSVKDMSPRANAQRVDPVDFARAKRFALITIFSLFDDAARSGGTSLQPVLEAHVRAVVRGWSQRLERCRTAELHDCAIVLETTASLVHVFDWSTAKRIRELVQCVEVLDDEESRTGVSGGAR